MDELLLKEYGIEPLSIQELDLGADSRARIYRVESKEGQSYFVKISEVANSFTHLLKELGIHEVIAPIPTLNQDWKVPFEGKKLTVFPFVEGKIALENPLSEKQWIEFGQLLRRVHQLCLLMV